MLTATPPGRVFATLRNGRVHLFGIACTVILILAAALPTSAPAVVRDMMIDPWPVVWALPAICLPVCLDPTVDFMQQALPRSPFGRRLQVLVAATSTSTILAYASARANGRDSWQSLTGLHIAMGICLALAAVLGATAAGVTVFTYVIANWVFGLDEHTLAPHPWAFLMGSLGSNGEVVGLLALAAGGLGWCHLGSRRS